MAVILLLLGTLGVSTAFGMMLLLPLYVQVLGGNEADFGVVLSSAALPAAICIGLLLCYPDRFRAYVVAAIAIAVYAVGSAAASLVTGSWLPLVFIGILLGTAWAVVYTASPMVMSELVNDADRSTYFGYLTGTQQLGIGTGPVLGRMLLEPLDFRGVFLAGGSLSFLAMVSTVVAGLLASVNRASDSITSTAARGDDKEALSFREAIAGIMGSEAVIPLTLVILFACLFTTLTQFQTTFAASRTLDYSVFYLSYTAAVIFSRFALAHLTASRFDTRLIIAVSVSLMALAITTFLVVDSSTLLYATASVGVGLGYGLALPNVQAQAVNVSEAALRPRILPLAGLMFQAAILVFPLVAGWIIVRLGYQALFAVLLLMALAKVILGWRHFVAGRGTRQVR